MSKSRIQSSSWMAIAVAIAGCHASCTTASIESVTITDQVDASMKPVGGAESFAPTVGRIFASVHVTGAPADTTVRGEWLYKGEVVIATDYAMKGSDEWIAFRLEHDALPAGSYQFRASLVGYDKQRDASFQVGEAAAALDPAP